MASRIKRFFRKITSRKSPSTSTKAPVFSGPTQPGTSVSTFRSTGTSVQVQSTPSRGGGGSGGRVSTPAPVQSIPKPTPTPRPKPTPQPRKVFGPQQLTQRQKADISRKKQQRIIKPQPLTLRQRSDLARRKQQKLQLRKIFIPQIPKKTISTLKKSFDVLSGGFLTSKAIENKQDDLNDEIESFNKKFGGKELTPEQFKLASQKDAEIKKEQAKINKEKTKLDSSKRKKFGELIFGAKAIKVRSLTPSERKTSLKENKSLLNKVNKKLQNKNINKLDKIRLNTIKKNAKFTIGKLEAGKDVKRGATSSSVPFASVGLPATLGKLKVVFVGSQTSKGGKIITTIALKSNKGIVGFAKGTTTKTGKTSVTITKGRLGKEAVRFPTGKKVIIKKRTFVAVERSKSTKQVVALRRETEILRKSKKVGKIKTIQTNIGSIIQKGRGRVIVAKGDSLVKKALSIPSGKILTKKKKGLQIDDFASVASIIKRKDLSLIIGKTITGKGDQAKFIGLIKGSSKVSKTKGTGGGTTLSLKQKQQFSKALKQVLSATTSAVAKASKTKGLTKTQRLALASTFIAKGLKTTRTIQKQTQAIRQVPASVLAGRGPQFEFTPTLTISSGKLRTLTALDQKLNVKGISIKQRSLLRSKQSTLAKQLSNQLNKQRQRTLQKTKQLQKQLQRALQSTKTSQLQKQKLLTRQKLLTKQVRVIRNVKISPKISILRKITKLPLFKLPKRKIIKKKVKKKFISYDVQARPRRIKGRKKPGLIKVNKKPLSLTKARDLRNFIVDKSLARTGSIKGRKRGKPQKPVLRVPSAYAKRTSGKFRTHKIRKGKRIPLKPGKVIERRKNILDTRSEKKQIGLRRKIAILNKEATKRKSVPKRKVSAKTLKALKAGREKRLNNLKNKRR